MTNNSLHKLIAEKNRLELEITKLTKQQTHKKRTHTLIQKGALLDKYFDTHHLSIKETEELLQLFANIVKEKRPHRFNKST